MPGLFQLARIFFHVHYSSAGIFSWESPLYEVFIYLFIYFSWGELEGGMCFCRNLNLDTRQNLNAWNRL